jgi:high-affinity nickel-transport protein
MNQWPVSVGFSFALGHSTVVIIAAVVVIVAENLLKSYDAFQSVSSVIGTAVSALFLLASAVMDIIIFGYKTYRRVRRGGAYVQEDLDVLLNNRGFLSRIFRSLFKLVTKSGHMFPWDSCLGLALRPRPR